MPENPDSPVTSTRDGGLVVHPTVADAEGESSIRIPQADTSLGAGFGEGITDDNRRFAADREPVAGFLIFGLASDVVEKWFKVNDSDTTEADPELDKAVQKELRRLKFKNALQQLIEFERLYGKALLVGGFADAKSIRDLRNDKAQNAQLLQVVSYPRYQFTVSERDSDPTSLRYGLPTIYKVNMARSQDLKESSNSQYNTEIHWSRCFEAQTRTNGNSILDLIWDDLTCGRNIRWGVGQWVYRVGGGFAVIKFPKETMGKPTSKTQLQDWANSKEWSNITHRTYIAILNEVMDFKFEGAQGATLNPEPFFDTNTKQIAKATGIPKSILEGAEAGALTGSEKNDQQYYKKISGIQSDFEDAIRWVIDLLVSGGQIEGYSQTSAYDSEPAGSVLKRMFRRVVQHVKDQDVVPKGFDYEIEWNSAFELNELDEARISLMQEQGNSLKLEYMLKDEVRAEKNLPPLPLGEGQTLKPSQTPSSFGVSTSPQDPNLADAKVSNVHPEFVASMQKLIDTAKIGALTRAAAIHEAEHLIGNYSRTREQDALNWLQKRTNQPSLLVLPPEMQLQLEAQRKLYLEQFVKIMDDALNLGH
jgi:phage-related protein (TIGR01555 family)